MTSSLNSHLLSSIPLSLSLPPLLLSPSYHLPFFFFFRRLLETSLHSDIRFFLIFSSDGTTGHIPPSQCPHWQSFQIANTLSDWCSSTGEGEGEDPIFYSIFFLLFFLLFFDDLLLHFFLSFLSLFCLLQPATFKMISRLDYDSLPLKERSIPCNYPGNIAAKLLIFQSSFDFLSFSKFYIVVSFNKSISICHFKILF